MTRKRKRLYIILACAVVIGLAEWWTLAQLTMTTFKDNLVFFVSPSDIAKVAADGRSVRLGGLVERDSVVRGNGGSAATTFRVTDGAQSVPVTYRGILPDLFREGQGVVTLGKLQADGSFVASEVLAKHDETYMPKEVADALKKSGHWNPAAGPPPPAARLDAAAVKGAGG